MPGQPAPAIARRTALYDGCGGAAYSLCLTIVEDEVLAADIVRACIWAAPDAERDDASRWLLAEAHRRAVAAVRAHGKRHEANRRTSSRRLAAFDALDDEQQTMLDLVYYQGLTVADLAERFATSPRYVLGVLTTALETFRSAIPAAPDPSRDSASPGRQSLDAESRDRLPHMVARVDLE